jgi:hypothetical protein
VEIPPKGWPARPPQRDRDRPPHPTDGHETAGVHRRARQRGDVADPGQCIRCRTDEVGIGNLVASTCMGVLLSGYRAVSRARRGGESRPYRAAHLRLYDEGARVRQVERRTEAIQNDHVETPERPLREGNAKDLVTYRLMCTAEILLTTKITRIVAKKRPPVRRSFPKFALSSQVVSGERHLAA